MSLDFDIWLLIATAAVAAVALGWIALRGWAWSMSLDFRITVALALAAALAALVMHSTVGPNPLAGLLDSSGPQRVSANGYVSSDTCAACHPGRYATWHDTYHRTMTQLPTPDSVVAPFDTTLSLDGADYHLTREDDRYLVDLPRPAWAKAEDSERVTRPIGLLTGSHHYQVYWLTTGNSRMLAQLPFVYLIEDQAWFPRRDVFMTPPDYTHDDEYGRWNYTCIRCHATAGRPLPWKGLMGMAQSEVGEFGIACEACHGPGEDHIEQMRDPIQRYRLKLDPRNPPAPGITNPARLDGRRNAQVCGQCHSINGPRGEEFDSWLTEGFHFRPGDELEDTRILFDAEALNDYAGYFWNDGMVRVAGREYSALRASPCYASEEFTCLSCHAVHQRADDPRPREQWRSDLLRGDRDTDASCIGCHVDYADASSRSAHTHHSPGSSGDSCINCHMPFTSYGLGKAIRSHQIASPDAALDQAAGRPNACTACHVRQPLDWAAQSLTAWYDQPAPPADETATAVPAVIRALYNGDAAQRALAAWHLGHAAEGSMAPPDWARAHLINVLDDPYKVVRLVAFRAIRKTVDPALRPRLDANWLRDDPAAVQSRVRALTGPGRPDMDPDLIARLRATRDERDIVISE